ncbi:MAG: YjbQ family protein [Candidatus Kerfeldbacteria bacterium]|nr:YjbQ family protein [Candidatus Kerfeldbacteria bacterium]
MTATTVDIHLHPKPGCDIIDITSRVATAVQQQGIQSGLVQVFSPHTTSAIRINENDPALLNDFKHNIDRAIPNNVHYDHNDIDVRKNARAHLASFMYGASESVPIVDGKLSLGQWQSIFFIDFDGGRSEGRHVIINMITAV